MSDWAAKVLAGVHRYRVVFRNGMLHLPTGNWPDYELTPVITEADALDAIAKLADGGGLVDRATAALEGVTDGPWAVEYKYKTTRLLMGNEVAMCDEKYYPSTPENDKDWHFIAFTRQWVPEAAAHIAALTAELAEAREQNRWAYIQAAMDDRQTEAEAEAADAQIAALTAAIDPAIAERAGEVLELLQQRDKSRDGYYGHPLFNRDGLQAADLITALLTANAALTAQVRESALQELASLGQAQEVYEAQKAAKAEAAALRAKLARIASAWPIVRDADCSGGTLASAMDEIEAAISDGAADEATDASAALAEFHAKGGKTLDEIARAIPAAIADGGKDA